MEDKEVAWGKPSLEEIKEYFATPCTKVDPGSVFETPRSDSSIELDDSFKTLLEKRRKEIEVESKKATAQTPATTKKTPGRFLFKTPAKDSFDDTMSDEQSLWMKCSDDTFMDMERMCENTIIEDPEEADAIERLLNECGGKNGGEKSVKKNPFTKNFADMTQLHDIEAPSMMWDQTIVHANSPKPSPIKMVGYLRPSTIIEESTFCSTTQSSDHSRNESKNNTVKNMMEFKEAPNSQNVSQISLDTTVEATRIEDVSELEEDPLLNDSITQNVKEEEESVEQEDESPGHISLNTTINESFSTAKGTDDMTSDDQNTAYRTATESTLTSSISSTTTLPEDLNVFPMKKKRNFYTGSLAESVSMSTTSSSSMTMDEDSLYNVKQEKTDLFLDSLDVMELSSSRGTFDSEQIDIPKFNDTLEEMDFIMKHGMKYMEQQNNNKSNHTQGSQMNFQQDKIMKHKDINVKTNLFPSNFGSGQKSTPNTFKKPQPISRLPVPKGSAGKKFEHIVSPIHTYIKDRPEIPLMSKNKGVRTGLLDRLHDKNRRDTVFPQDENYEMDPSHKPTLPLKGVIASSWKQEYDSRTPRKIPGGEKVQKLIGNNTPTVVKHEGRYKSGVNVRINADDTVDESFANLSVASGDVSIRVVKDLNRINRL